MAALSCEPCAALAAVLLFSALIGACGESFSASPASDAERDRAEVEAASAGRAGTDSAPGGSAGTDSGRDTGPNRDAPPIDATSEDAPPLPTIPTTGLVLWLRADRGVNEQSGQVAQWEDQSGNQNHATQATDTARPKLVSSGIGSRRSIAFDGIDDFMTLPSGFSDFSNGVSAFATIQHEPAAACAAVVELSNGSEIDDISFGQFENRLVYEVFNEFAQGGAIRISAPQLIEVVHKPDDTFELRQNAQRTAEGSLTSPVTILRTQDFVGKTLYSGCVVFPGQIAELLIYNRAVSDAELSTIERYLQLHANCCTP